MTTLRFRFVHTTPSVPLIVQVRNLSDLSISEIRYRISNGLPVFEITAFTNNWKEDRELIVNLVNLIEAEVLPMAVTEIHHNESESPVSNAMLRNLIQRFRDIELETQMNTMLELGEIDAPSNFEPYDDDWTQQS